MVVKSNGLGPVLAAIMHPGRLFNIVKHVSSKKKPKTVEFDPNGISSSLNNNAFQSSSWLSMNLGLGSAWRRESFRLNLDRMKFFANVDTDESVQGDDRTSSFMCMT
jgi:hypothetical protein